MRILRWVGLALIVLLAGGLGFAWWYDHVGQQSDPTFDTRVKSPAYQVGVGSLHPRVVMDEGHRNFHTASGRYKPFAELLRSDGYTVSSTERPFTAETLKDAQTCW